MKLSEKSMNVMNYFKGLGVGVKKTHKEVAQEMGFEKVASIVGIVTSLTKKGLLEKVDSEDAGKLISLTDEGMNADLEVEEVKDPTELSDKAKSLLKFLQEQGNVDLTAADIAANFGVQPIAINGVVNGLVKRNKVKRVEQEVAMPDGTTKTVKLIKLV